MHALPELAGHLAIGQPPGASHLLRGLANLRSPLFLPEGINGFLFESQWLYWAAAGVLALILLYVARSQRNRRLLACGAILAGVTLLWVGSAFIVDTPRERLYQAHEAMSRAALKKDVDGILSYFGNDFECPQLGIKNPGEAHQRIAGLIDLLHIESNTITGYRSEINGLSATTQLVLLTKLSGGTVKTVWRIEWEDLPRDDWKIARAELITVNDQPVGSEAFPTRLQDF